MRIPCGRSRGTDEALRCHWRLGSGNGVVAVEQTVPPEHGVSAQPAAHAGSADVGCAKDEGVQHFGLATVQLARGCGEFVVRHRERVVGGRESFALDLLLDRVIPARRTDACAETLANTRSSSDSKFDPVPRFRPPRLKLRSPFVAVERSGPVMHAGAAQIL